MTYTHKLSLLALICALILPAHAHEISFGAGALSSTVFAQLSKTDNALPLPNDIQWSATGTVITGEIYLGYAYNVNRGFDVGAEIFYDLGGPEVEQFVVDPRYLKYATKAAIGIRVVPGFNITPSTRVLAEVGYLFMKTDISVIDLDTAALFPSTSVSKDVGLVVYGVGMETMLYESFGLRASYNVAPRMGALDSSTSATTITSTDGSITYSASPAMGYFYLGGVARFSF